MPPRTRGLHHAGLYVADLEQSIAFYQAAFGLEVAERLTFGVEQIAFLRAGAARLELIDSPEVRSRGAGVVDHIAFEVPDLDAALEHLRQLGIRLIDANPIKVPALSARIAFVEGPDHERIELIEL
jgi:lactoylglutathione lyase